MPPATRSMSEVSTLRAWSTVSSSSPKSSPTGPTTRTSVKKLAASEKCTAEPPSARSRSPKGVLTASNAIEPTTVMDIGPESVVDVIYAAAMRAVQIEEFGGPEVLKLVDLPQPSRARRGADRGHARG